MMTSISVENHHHLEGRMSPLVGLLLLLSAKYKEASSTSDTAAYYTNNNNTEDCLAHLLHFTADACTGNEFTAVILIGSSSLRFEVEGFLYPFSIPKRQTHR